MKNIPRIGLSALCLAALLSVAVMSSCDKDSPENPEQPNRPVLADPMNVLHFDGAFFAGINRVSDEGGNALYSVIYDDFDRHGNPYVLDIYYQDLRNNKDDIFFINYEKKNYKDEFGSSYPNSGIDFTLEGCFSHLYQYKYEPSMGHTFASSREWRDTLECTYQDAKKLSAVRIVSRYEYSIDTYGEFADPTSYYYIDYTQQEISFTWENDNIVKIVKVETSYTESSDSDKNRENTETTVYNIDYDTKSLNESRQFPMFVSEFIVNDKKAKCMFPMTGIFGNFSKNMPVKVTVTKDGKVVETNDVVFSKIKVNGFNVIASERYKGETFEYLYE